LSDKDKLEKEYSEIHNAVLDRYFQGIDKNHKIIIYRAYNQLPDNENPFTLNQYHQFMRKRND
jgi:hypothetical protein